MFKNYVGMPEYKSMSHIWKKKQLPGIDGIIKEEIAVNDGGVPYGGKGKRNS